MAALMTGLAPQSPAPGRAATAAATNPQPHKLRIGLFADSRLQARWIIEAFAKVAVCNFAELAVIGCGAKGDHGQPPHAPWLWKLYGGLDRFAFRAGPDPGELRDLARELPHRRLVKLGECDLTDLDLDVAFALGNVEDRVLDGVARYGVWRFFFGEPGGAAEMFAGLREVATGAPLSGSGLKVRVAPGAPARLAYQSWSRTYPFSVARNRAQLLRKTAEFAWRALRELHRSGEGWLRQCKVLKEADEKQAALGNSQLLKNISTIAGRIAQRGVEKALNVEQWFLAFRFGDEDLGGAGAVPADFKGFVRLMPPKDRYWADPFVLAKGGRYFVFFEELLFKTGKAHISMLEIDRRGRASAPVRVLERDYHLSYPFLVEQDGSLFMIPESAQNATVEAYRCVEFPLRWKLERVLLSGLRCVDATFHQGAERWWMFANASAGGSTLFDDELHLFHAGRLLGDWQPHRRNPVKSDARCARPAGRLYWHNGALYRPAQICAPRYGSGLSINRVLRLTPHDYAERQIERILPGRGDGLLGIHTLNRAGDLTLIDAFTRRPRI